MVYTPDLKSGASNSMRVRVPPELFKIKVLKPDGIKMTPEEFNTLKRGDKVIVHKDNNYLIPDRILEEYKDQDIILEVAGKDEESNRILVFTKEKFGQQILGWLEVYGLPPEDEGKWAQEFTFHNVSLYIKKDKQIPRGDGRSCILCKAHNPWGEDNYPVNHPKFHACYSCRTSKCYLLNKLV